MKPETFATEVKVNTYSLCAQNIALHKVAFCTAQHNETNILSNKKDPHWDKEIVREVVVAKGVW